ncbi:molybdopterin cofactor-binding domain-containing protein [Sphingomonas sp. dw_22]|uniref:xanthine dehydrogenase family protein molybdopterin-binding subunit n=1 Tax=Sphingomonas sp. dw_22 TaxID=2721175 RepID=UPI001BD5E081|nr:molybdopterin cofactor-binding domain-containing protein [Sphingomonas sp. dw_22]
MSVTTAPAGPALSRRALLQIGAAVGGGLLVGFVVRAEAAEQVVSGFAPNAFIRINPTGEIKLVMPQVEMGQGVYTSICMILAEELDADWHKVTFEHAPPSDALYGNPVFGLQATGNSNSIRAFWTPLRKAGAGTRAILVQAAAKGWGVDPASCRTGWSEVIHDASGRRIGYGALAGRAAGLKPPADPLLKDPSKFRLIGKSLRRLDTPDKVNGTAKYGIDAMPPGVKFATFAHAPVQGGKVAHVDDARAKSVPGFRQVVVLDDLVAVVGDHMWAALQGLAALDIEWADGANAGVDTAQVRDRLVKASSRPGVVAKTVGDVGKALGDDAIEAAYDVPFLAHATMEPMNCTVHVTAGRCEIWTGIQVMTRAQAVAAKVTGLPPEQVIVNNHLLGGGFGRRLEVDQVETAVRIAQHVTSPVKVVWSREEDIRHDVYRPAWHDRLSARLDGDRISAWRHIITGSSVLARWLPPAFVDGKDFDAVDCAADMPYDIPNFEVSHVREEPPGVTTGFWRGVGPAHNVFVIESFIDELAHRAGIDPVQFRLGMLGKAPRLQTALRYAAEKSGWGTPLPADCGRGVSVQPAFASWIANVTEVEVDGDGEVKLRRITCVVDTGIAVNPNTVAAQIQGGLVFGLTAALFGEITIDKGRVQQSNFHDYRMLRLNETPPIDVYVLQSGEAPGGIGEAGTTAAAPALANAIFAATGKRLRRLPIDRDVLAGRKEA